MTRKTSKSAKSTHRAKQKPRVLFDKRRRTRFLARLRECGSITQAAREVGSCRATAYEHRERDPEFAAAWDEALAEAVDALEQEARRRAVEGWLEPVYYQGEEVGYVRRYSDRMLELLLKGHMPERYKDRHELSGPNGGPIPLLLTRDDAEL